MLLHRPFAVFHPDIVTVCRLALMLVSFVWGFEISWQSAQQENFRLPQDLKPEHYDLTIQPNIYGGNSAQFNFQGHVCISFTCKKTAYVIALHAHEIQVSSITLSLLGASSFESAPLPAKALHDLPKDFLIIALTRILTVGRRYKICMNFVGSLLPHPGNGFILDRLPDSSYQMVSQFMPTNARRVFPCFDEPGFRSTFNVTIARHRDTGYYSVSGMPLKLTDVPLFQKRVEDIYEGTREVSTHNVAFAVYSITPNTLTTAKGLQIRVFCRQDQSYSIQSAQANTRTYMEFFENYTQLSYPTNIIQILVTKKLGFEGKSQLGLISIKEETAMEDNLASSWSQKVNSQHVLARGLARMWFCNMVSPKWWDELWLTEGLSIYMEYRATDRTSSSSKSFDRFTVDVVHESMRFDHLNSALELAARVNIPTDITDQFNDKRLLKGAAIIRMLREWIGENTFRAAVQYFMDSFKYKAVTHLDFLKVVDDKVELLSSLPTTKFTNIMHSWIQDKHYPVVKVTKLPGRRIRAVPDRFLGSLNDISSSSMGSLWHIPFTYTTGVQPDFEKLDIQHIQPGGQFEKTDQSLADDTWILGNVRQVGYYRVNYDGDNWAKLVKQLKDNHEVIHPVNRAQIIDDAWALATSGYIDISTALSVLSYLDNEDDYIPWNAARYHIDYTLRMLHGTLLYIDFRVSTTISIRVLLLLLFIGSRFSDINEHTMK